MRLSLRDNRKPNLLLQAAIHRLSLYYSKIKQNKNWKEIHAISPRTGKNTTSQVPSSTLHLKGRTRYFRHRHTIKLYENKMDSRVIKSHQCSLERSHIVLIEINSEFWSRSSPLWTKADPYKSTSHKNLQKQNNEDFLIQLLYAWLLTNNKFSSSISIEVLDQPILLNLHTRMDFKHPTREYFWQIYHY